MSTHHMTCSFCEAMCGIEVTTRAGQITEIRGDKQDPFSQGHICPKATALKSLHEDPDRLRRPMLKVNGQWQETSWDRAFAAAADGLARVQSTYQNNALAVYLGNPNVHNLGNLLFMPQLVRALKTKNRYSATSADQLPHMFASYLMFGHQLLVPIPDIDRTDLFVIIGGNPIASNGSLMTAADMKRRMKGVQQRGGDVVVIDPRRTETARVASQHLFIRPEMDAILLLAMLRVIFDKGLDAPGKAAAYSDGLETLREVAKSVTVARAAKLTGIDAKAIEDLAVKLATTPKAALYGRMGASTQSFGGLCHWLINALNLVCGNFDVEGGVMFTHPAVDGIGAAGAFSLGKGSIGRWSSTVHDLPEFGGELPIATLGDEILDADEPNRIRGLLTIAGNPCLSAPNGARLDTAFEQLDFMVSIDFYLNETTRHADVILPPVSPMERPHYDLAFHLLAVRNTAKYSAPLFPKPSDSRHDWEIAVELMSRLAVHHGTNPVVAKAQRAAALALGPDKILAAGLLVGPYGVNGDHWMNPLTLGKLKKHPHGLDLGPLRPAMPGRLQTRNKRVNLAPEPLVDDVQRLLKAVKSAAGRKKFPYTLIGRRHVRSNNSWMHNAPDLMTGKDRSRLMMATSDGQALGIKTGGKVTVTSAVGSVDVAVDLNDDLMPGVVCLPHGFGHNREGTRLSVASKKAGVSINDITDHRRMDTLTGNAAFNGTPVRVEVAG